MSVGKPASAGCDGSQRIPIVPACSLNQLRDQNTGRNDIFIVFALARSASRNTEPPEPSFCFATLSSELVTSTPEGTAFAAVFGYTQISQLFGFPVRPRVR